MARTPITMLALAKIDLEEKTTDLKPRLKGKVAMDLADYARAYREGHGGVELELLVAHILGAFMDAVGGFGVAKGWGGDRGRLIRGFGRPRLHLTLGPAVIGPRSRDGAGARIPVRGSSAMP